MCCPHSHKLIESRSHTNPSSNYYPILQRTHEEYDSWEHLYLLQYARCIGYHILLFILFIVIVVIKF